MSMQFSHQLTDTGIYAHLLYRIHPDEAKVLDEVDILEVVKKAIQQQNKYLRHKECNILIFADTFGVIPEQGIGGRCGDSDLVNIFIDQNHEAGVEHNVKKWLSSALAHELCHARRYVNHPFGSTLADNLIEEGLACMFEEFIQPMLQVPYAHYLSSNQIKKAWEQARPLLKDKDNYNHDDWFYGGSGIEKWTGYSLGYDIVKSYLKKRDENDPAQFIDLAANDFIEEYGVKYNSNKR